MCTAFNTVLPYTQRLPMVQILQWLTTKHLRQAWFPNCRTGMEGLFKVGYFAVTYKQQVNYIGLTGTVGLRSQSWNSVVTLQVYD